MDYEKKLRDITNTAQSFCPLQKEELASEKNPLLTQITDLCANLAQKKTEVRQLKLENQNLRGKRDQQDSILIELKTNLDHKIQAEQCTLNVTAKYNDAKLFLEDEIIRLKQGVEILKDRLVSEYENIRDAKKEKQELITLHKKKENAIFDTRQKCKEIQDQNARLEEIISLNEAEIRNNKDINVKAAININQLQSNTATNQVKTNLANKELNAQKFQMNQLKDSIKSLEDKIAGLKRQNKETVWNSQKISLHNDQVSEVNNKLKNDLEAVQDHLKTVKKVNEMLVNNLSQYSNISQKVAKLVILEENF